MAETNTYEMLQDPEMQEIFESFTIETREILEQLDVDLIKLEKASSDKDLLNQIFRSFHTIKGTSGFLGLEKLQKLTHHCEDILNKLRKGEAEVNDQVMDVVLKGFDDIKGLMDVIEDNKNENYDVQDSILALEELHRILESGESESAEKKSQNAPAEKKSTPKKKAAAKKKAETNPAANPDAKAEPKVEKDSTDTKPAPKAAEKQTSKAPSSRSSDSSIRVDVSRLDELLNIVSELVLGRNRLAQINADASMHYEGTELSRDLAETTRQIDLMTTELQLAVMKTRMVKIGKVFNKFPRLVRDLSKEMGKEIDLEISGEETELDKTLTEEIHDPLVHLVRNSVDHGIESPEDRKKAKKPAKGKIKLSAEHEGNNIIISIVDDGKGIDPAVIKEHAIKKGIITKEKAADLTDNEVYNLIFQPGFSTAAQVTNVSGRGVGMDVVKTNIIKLRGIIDIESEVGKGTKIIIKLPLTLAIIPGLLVKIHGNTIVLPLNSVVEVVRVPKTQIRHVNNKQVINLRDTVLPLMDIGGIMFNIKTNGKNKAWRHVVVVGIAEKRYGIIVDELIGEKEVVIKSLGSYLDNVAGVAGATIMGDGTVVIIADIAEIINKIAESE